MISNRSNYITVFWLGFHFSLVFGDRPEKPQCPQDNVFDFIIVGSGSSGSALAARLSEVPNNRILLLDAGVEPITDTYIPYQAGGKSFIPNHLKFTYYTVPQRKCCKNYLEGRVPFYQGKALGGTSNINELIFTRGNKKDYDKWEKMDNKGWGYNDVLKYFMRIEDYRIPHTEDEAQYHSQGGPISISRPAYQTLFSQTFLNAAHEIGYHLTDVNGEKQTGFTFSPAILKNDLRWSNYHAYILPVINRTNLEVWKNSFVTKIKFDESKKATGVQFDLLGVNCSAEAKKEIIISAGAINSPKLLMLSGIGPGRRLYRLKIPLVVDLIGVGDQLIDHVYVKAILFIGNQTNMPTHSFYDGSHNPGKLLLPLPTENIGFISTTHSKDDWPEIEILQSSFQHYKALNPHDSNAKEKAQADLNRLLLMDLEKSFDSEESNILHIYDRHVIKIRVALMRPLSRGYLALRSANPFDPPIIDPYYLENPYDVQVLMKGLNETYRLINSEAYRRMGLHLLDFGKLFGCEPMDTKSAKYLECMIRTFSHGGMNFVGTNRMGPKYDPSAVVDRKLRVYGVKNLRVADASVIPVPITGHTHLPSVMIGERAADLIKAAWKLKTESEEEEAKKKKIKKKN